MPTQEDLIDALCRALPYVEEAESDPAYKPGIVAKLSKEIRQLIEQKETAHDRKSTPAGLH